MTASGGHPAAESADTPTHSANSESASLLGRYPRVSFSYNPDASRLVLQYRDPVTGQAMAQIPSEVALKQYEEAQKAERAQTRRELYLVVGDAADEAGVARGGGKGGAAVKTSAGDGGATGGRSDGGPVGGPVGGTLTPAPAPAKTSPVSSPVNLVI